MASGPRKRAVATHRGEGSKLLLRGLQRGAHSRELPVATPRARQGRHQTCERHRTRRAVRRQHRRSGEKQRSKRPVECGARHAVHVVLDEPECPRRACKRPVFRPPVREQRRRLRQYDAHGHAYSGRGAGGDASPPAAGPARRLGCGRCEDERSGHDGAEQYQHDQIDHLVQHRELRRGRILHVPVQRQEQCWERADRRSHHG